MFLEYKARHDCLVEVSGCHQIKSVAKTSTTNLHAIAVRLPLLPIVYIKGVDLFCKCSPAHKGLWQMSK